MWNGRKDFWNEVLIKIMLFDGNEFHKNELLSEKEKQM